MRVVVQDREALLSMLPVNTAAYLRTHGWQETHKEPGRYSIWSRSGGSEEPQVLLPLSRDFEDYAIRASEVLAAIAQVEDRSQLEILRDISAIFADAIRIHSKQDQLRDDSMSSGFPGSVLDFGPGRTGSDLAEVYNVYCDESCHLESDGHSVMVLGAVWCPLYSVRETSQRIREIKLRHGLPADFEIKWTKVSPGKVQFYLDVVDYFFDSDRLHFRGLVADKSRLRHGDFGQTHDDWYYKMYFSLLKAVFQPGDRFRVYIDIKDTKGAAKVRKLHEVLVNSLYDFPREIVERLQIVRSQEVEFLQLADLLTGILSAANRQPPASLAKRALIERMRGRSRYLLTRTTLISEKKVNLVQWKGVE